jgi:hypothetical protein
MESEPRGSNAASLKKNKPDSFDLALFKAIVQKIKAGNKEVKIEEIRKLLSFPGLITHHKSKITGRIILSDCHSFEYPHEHHTSKKLTEVNYDVIFVPKGYFKRSEKKFDVFLSRGHVLLETELKCITSNNPDTIAKKIVYGSQQSLRLVIDIHSQIQKRSLIEGLRTGCVKNSIVREILVFYNSRFFCLPKPVILSKKIFDILK